MSEEERVTCAVYVGRERQPSYVLEHCDLPSSIGPGELLLRVRVAGVCALDVPSSHARDHVPRVPGHEAVCEVLQSKRSGVDPGQRVIFSAITGCGACLACRGDQVQGCPQLIKYGHCCFSEGSGLSGTYSSHIVLRPLTPLGKVPSSLPDLTALLAACRLPALLAGVHRLPPPTHGDTPLALVQGCNLLGVLSCVVLKERGFRVACTDNDHSRLRLVEKFGATPVLQYDGELLGRSSPRECDVVVKAGPSTRQLLAAGLESLRRGGSYLLMEPTDGSSIPLSAVTKRGLNLIGVSDHAPNYLTSALIFLEATYTKYPYHLLMSPAYPLSDLQMALKMCESRNFCRVVLKPPP